MKRKIVEIIKVTNESMFETFIKNKIGYHNLSVYDIKKLIKAINNGHPWALMVNSIEIQTLLQCCEIDENPFHTMLNSVKQLNMKQNQFEFKLFDKVLVRSSNLGRWRINFYSNLDDNGDHICLYGAWNQCIPYNENTAHLANTTEPYEQPQPKEYHVWNSGAFDEWMTEDEFQNFIKTAVINNKDITDFHVLRVKP